MNNVIAAMGILVYMSSVMQLQMVCDQSAVERQKLQIDADEAAVSAALTGQCQIKKCRGKKRRELVLNQQDAYRAAESAVRINRKGGKQARVVMCTGTNGKNPAVRVVLKKDRMKAESVYEWVSMGRDKRHRSEYALHKRK